MAQSRACVMGIAGRAVNNSDGISLEWMDAGWRRVEPGRHGGGGEHYCTVRPTSGTGDVKCKQGRGCGGEIREGQRVAWGHEGRRQSARGRNKRSMGPACVSEIRC
jgi:hypothetical protein